MSIEIRFVLLGVQIVALIVQVICVFYQIKTNKEINKEIKEYSEKEKKFYQRNMLGK